MLRTANSRTVAMAALLIAGFMMTGCGDDAAPEPSAAAPAQESAPDDDSTAQDDPGAMAQMGDGTERALVVDTTTVRSRDIVDADGLAVVALSDPLVADAGPEAELASVRFDPAMLVSNDTTPDGDIFVFAEAPAGVVLVATDPGDASEIVAFPTTSAPLFLGRPAAPDAALIDEFTGLGDVPDLGCAGGEEAAETVEASADQSDELRWCVGADADGNYLRVGNPRNAAIEVVGPAGWPPASGSTALPVPFDDERTATLIAGGGVIEYRIPEGESGAVEAVRSPAAIATTAVQVGVVTFSAAARAGGLDIGAFDSPGGAFDADPTTAQLDEAVRSCAADGAAGHAGSATPEVAREVVDAVLGCLTPVMEEYVIGTAAASDEAGRMARTVAALGAAALASVDLDAASLSDTWAAIGGASGPDGEAPSFVLDVVVESPAFQLSADGIDDLGVFGDDYQQVVDAITERLGPPDRVADVGTVPDFAEGGVGYSEWGNVRIVAQGGGARPSFVSWWVWGETVDFVLPLGATAFPGTPAAQLPAGNYQPAGLEGAGARCYDGGACFVVVAANGTQVDVVDPPPGSSVSAVFAPLLAVGNAR